MTDLNSIGSSHGSPSERVRSLSRIRYRQASSRCSRTPPNWVHSRSVFSSIRSRSGKRPYIGMTGTVYSIVRPVENSCVTNALTCTENSPITLTLLRCLQPFLVHSVLILGSRGKSISHAIKLPQRLLDARSRSLVCQTALRQRFGLLAT
jgi:hypothetical protein